MAALKGLRYRFRTTALKGLRYRICMGSPARLRQRLRRGHAEARLGRAKGGKGLRYFKE
jgi:hypothetical protein